MKTFYSALINKSAAENTKLYKNLSATLKKNLKVRKNNVQLKKFNTFIFLSAEKQPQEALDPKTFEQTQKKLQSQLQQYYAKNRSKLQKKLKASRELKETSQIVGAFLKEIDPKIQKVFNLQLKKQLTELHGGQSGTPQFLHIIPEPDVEASRGFGWSFGKVRFGS
jgi:hypothetical protein